MKRTLLIASYFAFILMIGNPLVFAAEETFLLPAGTMTLVPPPGYSPKKSWVVFPHSFHFKFSCKRCHHEWEPVEEVKSCSSSGCHEEFWPGAPSARPWEEKKSFSMTGAYHKACRDCHREELKKLDKKQAAGFTGPIACDGCHKEPQEPYTDSMTPFPVPLGTFTLEAPGDVYAKRSSVEFPHETHFSFGCGACHHKWDGESQVQNCTTSGCHDQVEPDSGSRSINDPRNQRYYLSAYHKACLYCHRDLKKKRESLEMAGVTDEDKLPAFGPVTCSGCHQ
ncbi:cytochrome c3 family protein [Desulfospira joergensenii]|uniref:cytochrome c3 family protein n=1 Tax=Desulfospira joergensenii TaxID=53329 RepID=UPI0003B627A8|nr:cytochrome c3 family protein [Desulfospira joergensenii]